MTNYVLLTLLVALTAVVISLVSLVRTRKAEKRSAALQERTEERTAALQKRIEQKEYRGVVREFLLLSTHCEVAGRSVTSRTNEMIRGRNAILTKLAESTIPVERKNEIAKRLEGLAEPLNGLQQATNTYTAVFQKNKELEKIIDPIIQAGEPMDAMTHDKIVKACSAFERQAYGLSKKADAVLQLWDKELQRYREELSGTGHEATRQ